MPRLGIRAAGKAAGVAHSYVSRLVKNRQLARGSDGLVDLDELRTLLAKADPAQRRKPPPANGNQTGHHMVTRHKRSPAAVTTPDEARKAVSLIARVLADEGIIPDGPLDLHGARLADTILKAHERDLRMAERRKMLVPSIPVQQHYAKMVVGMRRMIEAMPARHASQMAARLGCDPGALDMEIRQMIHATLTEMSGPVPAPGLAPEPKP